MYTCSVTFVFYQFVVLLQGTKFRRNLWLHLRGRNHNSKMEAASSMERLVTYHLNNPLHGILQCEIVNEIFMCRRMNVQFDPYTRIELCLFDLTLGCRKSRRIGITQ
jgi:hypothetical protein